ncbi:quercetin 2,3-dioxygenase [Halomarina rubra]|uniref:Quercetin 2,3-dioxygenase n=1 Tax=Halomarina rubra TaxID=2071873 RepID=A0ABD6AS57_9EURY|nr:quercetin 2,3-dioxygenase [Halomarina rubra]
MSKSTAKPFVRDTAAAGDSYHMFGMLTELRATGEETDGLVGLTEQVGNRGVMTPLHVHHADDELFYVLDGAVTYYIDGDHYEATPGTVVYGPKGVPHAFRIDEDGTRVLDVRAAGGERFFRDVGTPVEERELPASPAPTEEEQERLGAVSEAYSLEILGPPPFDDAP